MAASLHAQHNPHAFLRDVVTVEDVVSSPMIADPLHRLDCCVITDGGGAIVVVAPEVARSLGRTGVKVLGHGEAVKHGDNGRIDLTYTGAVWSGPRAFEEAGVTPARHRLRLDLRQLHDHRAADARGPRLLRQGRGRAVRARTARSRRPHGRLPFNTDGGGLCNNHPGNRGGMTKILEAVRQLRGEAHPAVQVPDPRLALAHGTGGSIATRMGSATVILGTEDA